MSLAATYAALVISSLFLPNFLISKLTAKVPNDKKYISLKN